METKKIIVPSIIAVITLIALTVGATYAYFTFQSQIDFETPQTIEASTGAIGSGVAVKKIEGSDLTLDVTAVQMLQQDNDVPYYASGSATPQNIAEISVAGAGTFNCTYTVTATKSSTPEKDLYTKFQAMDAANKGAGQVYFTINEQTYDFNTAGLFTGAGSDTVTYSGSVTNITEAKKEYITANLAIVNSATKDQTSLNDSDITLKFTVATFDCTLVA